MLVFATDDQSYHGHPKPLRCPEDLARRSIALYYYQKVDKPLFVTPTNYMSLPGDGLGRRILLVTLLNLSFYQKFSFIGVNDEMRQSF